MTHVLRPLKSGEGGHAPLCEMVDSTQAEVYEAMANYLDDIMTPHNVRMFASGKIGCQYVVKLDDNRTVVTRPFRVEHPSDSKDCLDTYLAQHPIDSWSEDQPNAKNGFVHAAANMLFSGMVHLGLMSYDHQNRMAALDALKPVVFAPKSPQ